MQSITQNQGHSEDLLNHSLLGMIPRLSNSVHLGRALRIFMSEKFSANVDAASSGITLGEPLNQIEYSDIFPRRGRKSGEEEIKNRNNTRNLMKEMALALALKDGKEFERGFMFLNFQEIIVFE